MKITDKYIFFWKESFSQWHMKSFSQDGIIFNCAEQYMMYQKAMLFGDKETADKILAAEHPSDQKKLGRLVRNYDQKIWDANKYKIVYNGNMLKFTQNPKLLATLLETENKTLVEASPYDSIWGIGLDENAPGIENEENWKGENLLGYVLTDVRDNIRELLFDSDNLYSFILNGKSK
jgi:ribA/ribD-fused uncharacterized protein